MNNIKTTNFDLSKIDKSKGVNINVQIIDKFLVSVISEEQQPDKAIAFEIGHYQGYEKPLWLSKFFKAISSSVRYHSPHFKSIKDGKEDGL
jgi:hypothetical protein